MDSEMMEKQVRFLSDQILILRNLNNKFPGLLNHTDIVSILNDAKNSEERARSIERSLISAGLILPMIKSGLIEFTITDCGKYILDNLNKSGTQYYPFELG